MTTVALAASEKSDIRSHDVKGAYLIPDIKDDEKPSCVGDYLAMMKQLDIVDVNEYDIEKTCAYLDQVYDFSAIKQNQQMPFTRSRR